MFYVGLSRVTNIEGLYILLTFMRTKWLSAGHDVKKIECFRNKTKLNLSITLIHNTRQILLHLILFKLNIT